MTARFPPCPEEREDCVFEEPGWRTTTDMYFPARYDREGNNLNPDGNITSWPVRCTICGASWRAVEQYGKTTFTPEAR